MSGALRTKSHLTAAQQVRLHDINLSPAVDTKKQRSRERDTGKARHREKVPSNTMKMLHTVVKLKSISDWNKGRRYQHVCTRPSPSRHFEKNKQQQMDRKAAAKPK